MRDITSSNKGRDVEAAFHRRMRSYVDENGIVWSAPGCYYEADINATYERKDYVIHMWGVPKILRSLSEDYICTKNPASKELTRKVMLGLKRPAKWDDKGRCWIECGMGGLKADASVAIQSLMPSPVVGPLVLKVPPHDCPPPPNTRILRSDSYSHFSEMVERGTFGVLP